MKSRRVRSARNARRQAQDAVETYQVSSRGLTRVFQSIMPRADVPAGVAATRAAHHLAHVEALLPRVREAVRSCRYPGAENGDPAALVWGLWSHLSETLLHIRGALQSLEVLGQRYRYRNEESAAAELRAAARRIRAAGLGKRGSGKARRKAGTAVRQKDPGQKDPGQKDPGRKDPGQKDPGRKGPGRKAPVRKRRQRKCRNTRGSGAQRDDEDLQGASRREGLGARALRKRRRTVGKGGSRP
jgi:hypothetical protein